MSYKCSNRMNLWPAVRQKRYTYVIPGLLFFAAFLVLNIRIMSFSRISGQTHHEIKQALEHLEKKVNASVISLAGIPDAIKLEQEYHELQKKYADINLAIRHQAFSFTAFVGLLESFLPQNLRVIDMDFNQNTRFGITCILTGSVKDMATLTRFIEILEKHNDINNVFLHYHLERTDKNSNPLNEFDFRVAFDLGGESSEN